jgi:hypothetical protein
MEKRHLDVPAQISIHFRSNRFSAAGPVSSSQLLAGALNSTPCCLPRWNREMLSAPAAGRRLAPGRPG